MHQQINLTGVTYTQDNIDKLTLQMTKNYVLFQEFVIDITSEDQQNNTDRIIYKIKIYISSFKAILQPIIL